MSDYEPIYNRECEVVRDEANDGDDGGAKLQANLKAFLRYNYTEEPLSREKLIQIIEWFAGTYWFNNDEAPYWFHNVPEIAEQLTEKYRSGGVTSDSINFPKRAD